jgi:cytochrome c oxidase subunit IV
MSSHHNSPNDVKGLYEGDQSKLYSGVMSHHYGQSTKSDESKKQLGRIWKVTLILTVITIVEVCLGLWSPLPRGVNNTFFLLLTLFKAAYIVRVFMHLGDEVRNFIVTMLIPLTLFVWFIIAFLADGNFWLNMNKHQAAGMKGQPQQVDVHVE